MIWISFIILEAKHLFMNFSAIPHCFSSPDVLFFSKKFKFHSFPFLYYHCVHGMWGSAHLHGDACGHQGSSLYTFTWVLRPVGFHQLLPAEPSHWPPFSFLKIDHPSIPPLFPPHSQITLIL